MRNLNLLRRLKAARRAFLENGPTTRPPLPPLSDQELEEVHRIFPMKKFFIFGHARAGTTLLARLVRLHPEVHCNWQGHFFTRPPLATAMVSSPEVAEWLTRRSNRWNRGQDLSRVVVRAMIDFILEREARSLGKTIVGDKSPSSLLDGEAVRLLHSFYPDGRLIYIVRDGRDTVLSHLFQFFVDNPDKLGRPESRIRAAFLDDPLPFARRERSLFTEADLRARARAWVRNVEETQEEGRRLYGERCMLIRYEDILERPAEKISQVWAFLGASGPSESLLASAAGELGSNPDADWQRFKLPPLSGVTTKGKHGAWQSFFTDQDRSIFKQEAGSLLIALGYESGPGW
jgi:hypothetical protein